MNSGCDAGNGDDVNALAMLGMEPRPIQDGPIDVVEAVDPSQSLVGHIEVIRAFLSGVFVPPNQGKAGEPQAPNAAPSACPDLTSSMDGLDHANEGDDRNGDNGDNDGHGSHSSEHKLRSDPADASMNTLDAMQWTHSDFSAPSAAASEAGSFAAAAASAAETAAASTAAQYGNYGATASFDCTAFGSDSIPHHGQTQLQQPTLVLNQWPSSMLETYGGSAAPVAAPAAPSSVPALAQLALPGGSFLSIGQNELRSILNSFGQNGLAPCTSSHAATGDVVPEASQVRTTIQEDGKPSACAASSASPFAESADSNSDTAAGAGAANGDAVASPASPSDASPMPKLKSHHKDRWDERYQELLQFHQQHGHCLVEPSHSVSLCHWVKRQRYSYTRKRSGRPTVLTDDRQRKLERLNFAWDSHDAVWETRFQELLDFKRKFGHVNVPVTYKANRQLAIWVKGQRKQYRKDAASGWGKAASRRMHRYRRMNEVGFRWELRPQQQQQQLQQQPASTSTSFAG